MVTGVQPGLGGSRDADGRHDLPNTVARAYQNLERDGVIRTVRGGGTYVADRLPGLLKSEKLKRLRPLALQIAVEGTQLRLAPEDVLELVEEALEELGVHS